MSSEGSLRDQILTSETARNIVDYDVTSAFYDKSYVGLWLFEVIGRALDDLNAWTEETKEQIFPQTATWGLDYLEQEYSIAPDPTLSIQERREQILERMSRKIPITPYRIETVVQKTTGFSATVIEHVADYAFQIYVYLKGSYNVDFDALKKKIDRIKPSHLSYEIRTVAETNAELQYKILAVAQSCSRYEIEVD